MTKFWIPAYVGIVIRRWRTIDDETPRGATALSLRAQRSNLCQLQRLLRRLWLLAMT